MARGKHHINSTNVTIRFSGVDKREGFSKPKQVLLSFEKDETIRELPGIKLYQCYGENSIMIPYDIFRKMLVELFKEVSDVDGTFHEDYLAETEPGSEPDSDGGSNRNVM